MAWRLCVIGLWQGCWALWALMQRDPLRGGSFAGYLRSRPIAASRRLCGDGLTPPSGCCPRPTVLGMFFGCLLVTFAARGLMGVWDFDGRCLPMVWIAFGLLALLFSGLYLPLQMAHEAARAFSRLQPGGV